jgi:hypothetical protein
MIRQYLHIKCFKFLCLIILSVFFYSCAKEKQDLPRPLKDIIASTTNCACEPYIDEYLWRNKTVYLMSCAGPSCNCITVYYDENGVEMNVDAGYSPADFRKDAKLVADVWRCKP